MQRCEAVRRTLTALVRRVYQVCRLRAMREGEINCKGARITHCSSAARELASLLACHLSPRFCPKLFAPLAWQGRESRVERASDKRRIQPTAAQFNPRAGLLHGGM